jgi:predicted dehydrogenase
VNRRVFFQAALSAAPLLAQPNRKFKTALIGSGWWGMNILREALASGRCSAVALADPDPNQMDKAQAEITKLSSDQPRRYKNYREMLAKERPDIAIVATPDHWHALPTVDAVKAGRARVCGEADLTHDR